MFFCSLAVEVESIKIKGHYIKYLKNYSCLVTIHCVLRTMDKNYKIHLELITSLKAGLA